MRLDTPLTAHEAYSKAVEMRRKGYSGITATDTRTGRVIVDVQRLLSRIASDNVCNGWKSNISLWIERLHVEWHPLAEIAREFVARAARMSEQVLRGFMGRRPQAR